MALMKLLVLALASICTVATNLPAQTRADGFISPDGAFRLEHTRALIRCNQQANGEDQSGSWTPAPSCSSYSPVCSDDPGMRNSITLICFAYPKASLKHYPTFEAAAFWVAEVREAQTEEACLSGSNAGFDSEGPGKITIINGIKFVQFERFSAGMSHHLEEHIYRTFHHGACYQLGISDASGSGAAYSPPIKDIPEKKWAQVNGRLAECLNSFRFLK
jgi:hypothetical protein